MATLTATARESLRDDLDEAQQHLNDAIALIDRYVRATGDAAAEAYILDQLRILAGRNHGFLSSDMNIDDLIQRLDERDDEEAEDEQEETVTYPRTKLSANGATLYLLQNNNGPILNSFGEPMYVTIPED